MPRFKLVDIVVLKRTRRDLGDLKSLATSIKRVGLLHPVVVTPDRVLVAGQRRLEAVRLLGWLDVAVTVVRNLTDALPLLRAESDENTERKDLTPSEAVALAELLETQFRAEAKTRQRLSGHLVGSGKEPDGHFPVKGKARDHVALAVGMSARTLGKAREVMVAATERPRRYGTLVEEMDKGGKIDRAWKKMRLMRERDENARAAKRVSLPRKLAADIRHCSMEELLSELPEGSVDAIVCDPPYGRASIPLYAELARLAKRVLKPGGVLAVMIGTLTVPEVLASMTPHMPYRWMLSMMLAGPKYTRAQPTRHLIKWKPILLLGGIIHFDDDLIVSGGTEKTRHEWEQSLLGIMRLVEKVTRPGALICDPFLGNAATTAIAALRLGRRFVGCDIDGSAVCEARARIASDAGSAATMPVQVGAG